MGFKSQVNDKEIMLMQEELNNNNSIGYRNLSKVTGISQYKCRQYLKHNKNNNKELIVEKKSHDIKDNIANSIVNRENKPYTLEDIIKMFNINTSVWESDRITTNSWDVTNSTGQTLTNYQTKVTWKKIFKLLDFEVLIDNFIKKAEAHAPKYNIINKYPNTTKDRLLVLNIRDLHLGKMSWKPETGFDYDIKIAMKYATSLVNDLLAKALVFGFEEILFISNDDFIHVDNNANTTSHGTKQDVDGRVTKMLDKGEELLVSIIDNLRQYAPVKLMFVNGNHSEVIGYGLERTINAWYRNDKSVNFHELRSPKPRKYYQWGKCSIGATHGQNTNIKTLPSLMSVEQPKLWGDTLHRTIYCAHKHHKEMIKPIGIYEGDGAVVKMCRAVSPAGKWANDSGYIGSLKGAEAEIFDKQTGSVCSYDSVINIS